jgi:hypothetical protein
MRDKLEFDQWAARVGAFAWFFTPDESETDTCTEETAKEFLKPFIEDFAENFSASIDGTPAEPFKYFFKQVSLHLKASHTKEEELYRVADKVMADFLDSELDFTTHQRITKYCAYRVRSGMEPLHDQRLCSFIADVLEGRLKSPSAQGQKRDPVIERDLLYALFAYRLNKRFNLKLTRTESKTESKSKFESKEFCCFDVVVDAVRESALQTNALTFTYEVVKKAYEKHRNLFLTPYNDLSKLDKLIINSIESIKNSPSV